MKNLSIFLCFLSVAVVFSTKWVPPSNRCSKILTPAARRCDRKYKEADNFCSAGYVAINKDCKGKETIDCGKRFDQHDADCKEKQDIFWDLCDSVYTAYRNECASPKEIKEELQEIADDSKESKKHYKWTPSNIYED